MNRYLKSFTLLTMLACIAMPAFSQQSGKHRLNAIIKPEGWKIPHLKNLAVVNRSLWKTTAEGTEIYRSELRMNLKESMILFEDTAFYVLDESGKTLTIHAQPVMAEGVVRYDVGGKAFAYTIIGTCVSVGPQTKRGKSILFLGCKTGFAFYDEDGDGVLETLNLRASPISSDYEFSIPMWARKAKQ